MALHGLDALQNKLAALDFDLVELQRAAVAGAMIIADGARSAAPVDKRPHARNRGALARGIIVEVRKTAQLHEALVVVGPSSKQFYGYFLEFGTKHMHARPWLRPALEATRERAMNAIRDALALTIQQKSTTP